MLVRLVGLALVSCVAGAPAQAGPASGSAAIPLQAVFGVRWDVMRCPRGTAPSTLCFLNVGRGSVRGYGNATERYTLRLVGADTGCAGWRYGAALTISGRGSLTVAARNKGCFSPMQTDGTVYFTVVRGSGDFLHAEGSGTIVSKNLSESSPGHGIARDTWSGRLSVPG